MLRKIRRVADAFTTYLVPKSTAGACPACVYYPDGSCGGGQGQRICCYYGSACVRTCGCY